MALTDYAEDAFTWEGSTRRVFRQGSGPAVLVIHEIPGITPAVLAFADRVAGLGCTAVLPSLLGKPGGGARDPRRLTSALARRRISRELHYLALRQASPVTEWLRALGRQEPERCGEPAIGVVGMCFSGGFALAMMVDDDVLAPVLSQPSLPAGLTVRTDATWARSACARGRGPRSRSLASSNGRPPAPGTTRVTRPTSRTGWHSDLVRRDERGARRRQVTHHWCVPWRLRAPAQSQVPLAGARPNQFEIDLRVHVEFNGGALVRDFGFRVHHNETPNVGPAPQDLVDLPTLQSPETIQIDGEEYALVIVG